ncbi:MAG TPA: malto-oligosyltrehalose synthase [Solirubrobacteraceae bacterium]|nr:malto-oligosyltrehalose synthase [Solirubrobacteraceae bacterium]
MTEFRATYRLQLGEGLTFADARALVPYLRDLGVSHVYLSPSFAAREGSTHGYDVVDPTRFSDALGGEEEFRALAAAAREAGLGIVLDIVPNHMAADDANPYWADPERRRRFFDLDEATGRHRRFFDIDHLAGVRQEDPEVFEETHRLALAVVREGLVDGLRIDHPDGLADPAGYLERLRDGGAAHVWVEKILDPGEQLRPWAVEGTVGYEFLNDVAALFVDPAGEPALTALWEELSGDARPFGAWAAEAKLEQVRGPFAADVDWLRRLHPAEGLEAALAALPVYRTYIRDGRAAPEDLEVLREAGLEGFFDGAPEAFVTRFQQTTPPVMAKGVEDTAFYRYARLLALNDVGGDPSRFGIGVEHFHRANRERAERVPRNLLVSSTHDTKRSGDARARLTVLAGMADEWAAAVRRWRELCAPLRSGGAPDPVEEYTIFQTLACTWPLEEERLVAYMEKAMRERKVTSNWIEPDEAHEAAVLAYCRALYGHRPFLDDFEPLAADIDRAGSLAALRQTALKLTVPGVPDVYQGDELPAYSLVDPDNRRPVDWAVRRALLDQVRAGAPVAPEAAKLALVHRLLALRARRPEAFAGGYEALDAGPACCAFVRGGAVLVAVATRRGAVTGDVALPAGEWRPALGGPAVSRAGRQALGDLLDELGIAVLERA